MSFAFKKTGYGAVSDKILMDTNGNILPSRLVTTRSGHHGERQYRISANSKVIIYDVYKSNLGNVYIKLSIANIDDKCNINTQEEWILHSGKQLITPVEKLPKWLQQILINNQNKLPLLDYVYF